MRFSCGNSIGNRFFNSNRVVFEERSCVCLDAE